MNGLILPKRKYLGYVTTSRGFDVFYGVADYVYLKDVLPEETDLEDYIIENTNNDIVSYGGYQYESYPGNGYIRVENVQKKGMKYSVELTTGVVRILSAKPFTEDECPDIFEKLPEVDFTEDERPDIFEILPEVDFTEDECPDSFEKLPEVDEDLLSIMADIQELVNQYGPEIPDEVKNGTTKGTTCLYKPNAESYYVAIGDDTAAAKNSYVNMLAEGLKISHKNLADNGMLIEDVDAGFLEANAAEIEKADLITIGFSVNGFAAVAVEEVLKNI